MKYHIKVGDVVKYADMDDGIKIVPSELTSIPPKIKEMWDEADEKKISMKQIVEKVKKVRSQLYNEEYGIQDKNDIPVLAGAVQESAVLVTEDNLLKKDAKKYLECETPSEALKRLSI